VNYLVPEYAVDVVRLGRKILVVMFNVVSSVLLLVVATKNKSYCLYESQKYAVSHGISELIHVQ